MATADPTPRREFLRLEVLRFDPRLQMRSCEGDTLFDEGTVAACDAILEDGRQFRDPLEAVFDGRYYWVVDGFSRGEAYRRKGFGLVECLVWRGTFQDARLRALASNSAHGKNRTPADCRRAFTELFTDKELFAKVMAGARYNGGVARALAAACGLHHSTVVDYLSDLGYRIEGWEVRRKADGMTAAGAAVGTDGPSDGGLSDALLRVTLLDTAREAVRAARRRFEAVLDETRLAADLPGALRRHGLPEDVLERLDAALADLAAAAYAGGD